MEPTPFQSSSVSPAAPQRPSFWLLIAAILCALVVAAGIAALVIAEIRHVPAEKPPAVSAAAVAEPTVVPPAEPRSPEPSTAEIVPAARPAAPSGSGVAVLSAHRPEEALAVLNQMQFVAVRYQASTETKTLYGVCFADYYQSDVERKLSELGAAVNCVHADRSFAVEATFPSGERYCADWTYEVAKSRGIAQDGSTYSCDFVR